MGHILQVLRGIRVRAAVVGKSLRKLGCSLEALEEFPGLPIHDRLLTFLVATAVPVCPGRRPVQPPENAVAFWRLDRGLVESLAVRAVPQRAEPTVLRPALTRAIPAGDARGGPRVRNGRAH